MMYLIICPYFPSPKLFQTQTHFPTVSHFNMKALLFDSICNALCSVFYLVYHVFFKYTDEINTHRKCLGCWTLDMDQLAKYS